MRSGPGNSRASAAATAAAAAAVLLLTGCGGGEDSRAGDAHGTYTVDVVRAQFPVRQRLAQQSMLEIAVRNGDERTIPDLAVTLHGFGERNDDAQQPRRSLWLVDVPPAGVVTESSDTWTAGAVKPGETATLRWVVTPIMPGARTLSYELAPAIRGNGRVMLASGHAARGSIAVRVTDKPPNARVDPRTGKVIREKPAQEG